MRFSSGKLGKAGKNGRKHRFVALEPEFKTLGIARAGAWHGINDAFAQMAEPFGVSLYVEPVRGRLAWRFRRFENSEVVGLF